MTNKRKKMMEILEKLFDTASQLYPYDQLEQYHLSQMTGLNYIDELPQKEIEKSLSELEALEPNVISKQELSNIITSSTLYNIGKDGHNALSELVEAIYDKILGERE